MTDAEEKPFAGTARFQLRRRLGAGAFGVVYEAYDRERSSVVALKTLRRAGDEAPYRLKKEFRSLADITHPNLAALYELLSEGGQWFFTMELVEGKSFRDYVCDTRDGRDTDSERPEAPVDSMQETLVVEWPANARAGGEAPAPDDGYRPTRVNVARLRSALLQAASGIRALHAAGKLHRDIKSSNVLVTPSGRVVLLDFGLVTELDLAEGDQSMAFAGTPTYMSPEQGAGHPVSQASDWYSFGVMLYESLTGRSPFAGNSAEILREKQIREPKPSRELASGVPDDLDELCCELLRRDPGRRPDGAEILLRLGGQLAHAEPSARSDSRRPFVGRQRHLSRLLEAFREAERGEAVTVALHGESGVGKTALVRRFLDTLRASQPVVILAGRCYERESVPYKALDSLMDGLSNHLRRLPQAKAEALLPRDVLALARLFPVLRRVEAVAGARRRVLEILDVHELRRRAFGAFRELAARLAEESPIVLFIDDLHWGDVDSAAMLEELMRPPEAPPLLLIVAYRSEEADTSPALMKLLPQRLGSGEWREVEVDRLDPEESRDLARALLTDSRRETEALAESVARESSGNPFFLSELARSALGEGPVVVSADKDEEASITLDRVIRARVARLSPGARRFLEMVAVAGRPVRFDVIRDAAEPDPRENVVQGLRIGHLIRTRETERREEIETYHDRIREAVAEGLSPQELRERHQRLAVALEASGQADPEWLAMHWKGAEDPDRAADYAATAARRASETLAFDQAARLYLMALELWQKAEPEARRALQVHLGDALANAGRGADAADSYMAASRGAGKAEGLELQRRAAEQLLLSGHIDQSLPVLRGVLVALGFRYAESNLGSLLLFLYHRLRIRLRGLKFRERDASQVVPEQLMRIDTLWSLSSGLSIIDTPRGRDFQARHLLLALKTGEPYRVARAISAEAGYSAMGGPPNARRTARLVEMATQLAARVGHPQAIGVAQLAVGITAYAEGRWKTAWDLARQGEAILRERCTGVTWELDTFHIFSLRALFYLGEIAEISSRVPTLLREARERDDLFAETSLRARHGYVAWLAAGEPKKARADTQDAVARWSKGGFYVQHYHALFAQVDIALYLREPRVALSLVRESREDLRRSRLMRVHYLRIEWLHLCARIRIATAAQVDGPESESLLEEALSDVRRLERERVRWADGLAALARAGIASVRGDWQEAARRLGFAASHFAVTDMALYAAVSRRCLGIILGGGKGKALVDSADAWMRDQKIENPADFAAMLAPGRYGEEASAEAFYRASSGT
jgi:serine/threonine protein kinase